MRSSVRAVALTLIAGLLLPLSAAAQAQEPVAPAPSDWGSRISKGVVMGFDVLIVRPLGLAATAVGTAAFVPAVVVTAANGRDSMEHALEFFILVPGKYVFQRPLGEF